MKDDNDDKDDKKMITMTTEWKERREKKVFFSILERRQMDDARVLTDVVNVNLLMIDEEGWLPMMGLVGGGCW